MISQTGIDKLQEELRTKEQLTKELKSRKVTQSAASKLVKQYSELAIRKQIDNFDHRIECGESLTGGWLRVAIEADYSCRADYKPEDERIAQRKAAQVREAKKAEREAERRRKSQKEREDYEQTQLRENLVRPLWDALSDDEKEERKRAVLRKSPTFAQLPHILEKICLQELYREYVDCLH